MRSTKFIKVSFFALKSGFTEEEILERYKIAKFGHDNSFTLKNQLFALNQTGINNEIIWLGEVPFSWYEEDLKIEKEEKERKERVEKEKLERLFRRAEGTRTERKRDKRSSNLLGK